MDDLETTLDNTTLQEEQPIEVESSSTTRQRITDYIKGCFNPDNARLYGNFQERAALNITQFPKIQGSLLIRMGMVYPLMSALTTAAGIPEDAKSEFMGMTLNYHTWAAGYLAYLAEIQLGLSKYSIECVTNSAKKIKEYWKRR